MADNIRMRLTEDNVLVIRVDMNVEGKESSTGKSDILAQSERFEDLGKVDKSLEGCTLNLMVLRTERKGNYRGREKGQTFAQEEELDDVVDDHIPRGRTAAPRGRERGVRDDPPRARRRDK